MPDPSSKIPVLIAIILVGMASLVFVPGIHGPFIFDDFPNIVQNRFLRFDNLNLTNLFQAAMSSDSGPFKRPLAMLTFGLNAWFADGTKVAEPFKIWNLIIHTVNGVLVFVLTYKILETYRLIRLQQKTIRYDFTLRHPLLIATSVAALWTVHPIQLTSILYVVQRMTSLSALFVLLALISYVFGRRYQEIDKLRFNIGCFFLPIVFMVLGAASKENAILVPLYVLVLELTLYAEKPIWRNWQRLPINRILFSRWFGIGIAILVITIFVFYSLPGYAGRPFTLGERLLTETRVLSTYLYLIFFPRLSWFGVHHDDIEISHGLLNPTSTIFSLTFLLLLIYFAWRIRKHQALVSLGILFFFCGHLLESTALPLEIMHEHRNYLPSFGIILTLVTGTAAISDYLKHKMVLVAVPTFFLLFSYISYARASDWANLVSLYSNEVIHHPKSVSSVIEFSGVLKLLHRNQEAIEAVKHAITLQPDNPILYIELRKYEKTDTDETRRLDSKINLLLKEYSLSPFLKLQFESVLNCLSSECRHLLNPYEKWLVTILNRDKRLGDPSYFLYLLGRTYILQGRGYEAIQAFKTAIEFDRSYIQPRFMLFYLYIDSKQLNEAKHALAGIKKATTLSFFRWEDKIRSAQAILDSYSSRASDTN